MTTELKQQILPEIFSRVTALAYSDVPDMESIPKIFELITAIAAGSENYAAAKPKAHPVEMLTIKECKELVQGVSEHTIRKLAKQGKIKSVRAGEGKRGKILISKDSFLDYFQK